jgi:hypothetical protein
MLVELSLFVVVSADASEPDDVFSGIEVLPYNALEVDDAMLVELKLFVAVSVAP